MPYFKVTVTKEVSTEVYIEAENEEKIKNLFDDQMGDIIDDQCHHSDWVSDGFIDLESIEEIDESVYSEYEGTNLEQFLNE